MLYMKSITKCKNIKRKVSWPMLNEKFEVSDGSYCVSDIKEYFECHEKNGKLIG